MFLPKTNYFCHPWLLYPPAYQIVRLFYDYQMCRLPWQRGNNGDPDYFPRDLLLAYSSRALPRPLFPPPPHPLVAPAASLFPTPPLCISLSPFRRLPPILLRLPRSLRSVPILCSICPLHASRSVSLHLQGQRGVCAAVRANAVANLSRKLQPPTRLCSSWPPSPALVKARH